MISNFQEYYKVVEYFSNYTKARIGYFLGVNSYCGTSFLMKKY
jgi:hypothetical protein